jgi:uncharacterized protein (DUF1501 family)
MTTLPRVPIARGLSRRSALLGLGSAVTLAGVGGPASLALASAPTDQRFVVVLLRGALDGMSAVVPYGNAALMSLRAPLVPPAPGQPEGMGDLGGFFGLHPALPGVHGLYGSGEALIVHAVAGPNRSRSHFEAQDSLESGADHRLSSGWLNRAVQAMAPRPTATGGQALAVGVTVPLLLRARRQSRTGRPKAAASRATTSMPECWRCTRATG